MTVILVKTEIRQDYPSSGADRRLSISGNIEDHLHQSLRPGNGNDPRDSRASATATGCTTRCTRVRTIPGPKTPTAPENEALAYGWICLFT